MTDTLHSIPACTYCGESMNPATHECQEHCLFDRIDELIECLKSSAYLKCEWEKTAKIMADAADANVKSAAYERIEHAKTTAVLRQILAESGSYLQTSTREAAAQRVSYAGNCVCLPNTAAAQERDELRAECERLKAERNRAHVDARKAMGDESRRYEARVAALEGALREAQTLDSMRHLDYCRANHGPDNGEGWLVEADCDCGLKEFRKRIDDLLAQAGASNTTGARTT